MLDQQLLARKNRRQKNLEISKAKELRTVSSQQRPVVSAEEQKAALEMELAREIETELQAVRDKMVRQKEQILQEERQKLASKLNETTASNLSDDERERLVANHEASLNKLGTLMDQERERQERELLEALETKKKKKAAKLDASLQLELQERRLNEELKKRQQDDLALLEAEQQRERQRAIEDLHAEKAREAEGLRNRFEKERILLEEKELAKIAMQAVEEKEKEQLLNEAQAKIELMVNALSQEQRKQEALLEIQISEKRAKRAAILQQKQAAAIEEKLLGHIDEAEREFKKLEAATQGSSVEDDDTKEILTDEAQQAAERLAMKVKEDRERFEAEMAAALAEQERMKAELLARQEMERQQLEEEMAREALQYEERLRVEQEKRMEELRQRREQIEATMSRESEGLSQEERGRMIAQHESQLRQLEQEAVAKKAAMDDELQAKIARRRSKKQAQLEANKIREIRETEEQTRADTDLLKQRLQLQRLEALQSMIQQGLGDEALSMCRQMHEKDCEELRIKQSATFAREMAAFLSKSEDPISIQAEEKRIRHLQELERDALSVAHQSQLAQLQSTVQKISSVGFLNGTGKENEAWHESAKQNVFLEDLQAEKRARLRKLQVDILCILNTFGNFFSFLFFRKSIRPKPG